MSHSVNWSVPSTSYPAPSEMMVVSSGRSRMSIPNLVHGVTTAEVNVFGGRRASLDDRGGGGSSGSDGGGREEGSQRSEVQSPTENPPSASSAHPPKRRSPSGPRYHCTYSHPVSSRPCMSWPQGFSSQSDLSRHYTNIHGQEEIRLIKSGELSFEKAQVVTSTEKLQRLEQHFSSTKSCESCGAVFSSGRRDAISRHIRKGVCTKKKEKNP